MQKMSRPVRPVRVRLLYNTSTVYLLNKTGRLDLGGLRFESPVSADHNAKGLSF